MTARRGGIVVLAFAAWWLWIGASVLPMPWRAVAFAIGGAAWLATGWRVLHRAAPDRGRGFDQRRFYITLAIEVVALNLVAWGLGRADLMAYLYPAIGIVVGLHFIGLWWATHDRGFIELTVGMTALNVVALGFADAGAAMVAISGLGSCAALLAAAAR